MEITTQQPINTYNSYTQAEMKRFLQICYYVAEQFETDNTTVQKEIDDFKQSIKQNGSIKKKQQLAKNA